MYSSLIRTLLARPCNEQPTALSLAPFAVATWQDFAQFVENNQGDGRPYESIQDWTSKLPGAALRIAGLLHLAELSKTHVIQEATIRRSVELCMLLVAHAQAAFGTMGGDRSVHDAKAILRWILATGKKSFTRTDAWKVGSFTKNDKTRLQTAVNTLLDRGIIAFRTADAGKHRGVIFHVNPALTIRG
jgi:putative DNA primase/helicase